MKTSRKREHQQQTCKVCCQPDKFNFFVPNDVWSAIVPHRYRCGVVCLYCFDEFAREAKVDYADHLSTLAFAGNRASFEFRVISGVSVAR